MDKNQKDEKKSAELATKKPKEAGFGKGSFFSGKRKKNSESAKCNTSCSGSCK